MFGAPRNIYRTWEKQIQPCFMESRAIILFLDVAVGKSKRTKEAMVRPSAFDSDNESFEMFRVKTYTGGSMSAPWQGNTNTCSIPPATSFCFCTESFHSTCLEVALGLIGLPDGWRAVQDCLCWDIVSSLARPQQNVCLGSDCGYYDPFPAIPWRCDDVHQ